MKEVFSYDEFIENINKEDLILVYVSTPSCGVCIVDSPKILDLSIKLNIPLLKIDATKVKEAIGQLEVFSVPAVIVFHNGKEAHRQARIIDFDELEYRILQYK